MSSVPPESGEESAGPAIGQDEWVARHGERRTGRPGWVGELEDRLHAAPWYAWLVLFVAACSLLPVVSQSGYVRRVAFDTVLYMLLALGLNLVVGWGGLLDLGYVAFYGVGAYAYALLDSEQIGVHLPTLVSIPLVVGIGAIVGFLVGLPSRRLVGDYLAIVTLFFLQIFLTVATNGNSIFGHDLTGGANGILRVDPLELFGHSLTVQHQGIFAVSYLYVAVAVFALIYAALHFVNHSRTGRAWRSLREDPLAAEAMGMPVSLLKLLAFSFGAAVAALTGTIFASLNASTFPLTFSFPLLITVYTMVILGGQGSQAGVVVGAVVVSVLLELLRDPGNARLIFYAFGLLAIVIAFGRSRKLAALIAGTLVFGFIVHAIAGALHHSWISGHEQSPSGTADLLTHWVVVPTTLAQWVAPVSYIGLIGLVLVLTLLHGLPRDLLLVPTIYLAAFVWENVLLPHPETTRYIVLGALLIALMILRPNGLFGERRVEIV
jgi:ABC-type branched-subunit amino acid transport system permease subunit